MNKIDKKKLEQIFFEKLEMILEQNFPKHKCQERSHALVLNAYANLYFKEALDKILSYEKNKTN